MTIKSGSHPVITVRKTADQTKSDNVVYGDDLHLFIHLPANSVWTVLFYCFQDCTAVADMKLKFTIPAGTTGKWGNVADYSTTTDLTAEKYATGAGVPILHFFYCLVITGGTAGTLQLQWVQDTAQVSDTKLLAGSCLVCTRLK